MALAGNERRFNGHVRDGDGRAVVGLEAFTVFSVTALAATVVTIAPSVTRLGAWQVFNPDPAAVAYVQLFNVAGAAAVVLGTTVPTEVVGVAPRSSVVIPGVADYGLGLKVAATTTPTGATAATTPVVLSARFR